jgi:diaminopimelate epimerase
VKIDFHKYHGAGNDFIIIDNRELNWNPGHREVAWLCDRHFGIGADGLMLLSGIEGYDFRMTYYNSDGNESTLCGNGGRCLAAYASLLGLIRGKTRFYAVDGEHEAVILSESGNLSQVALRMNDVTVEEPVGGNYFIDTGSPHYVIFGNNVGRMDIVRKARKIRYDTCFAEEGTNVDFVEVKNNHLFVRTYERGVEDETLSCGTGITAAALAFASMNPGNPGNIVLKTRGGELRVRFGQEGNRFTNVWLEGAAERVFSGTIGLVDK